MTCIKSINRKWRFSNEKWALTQTQLCRPKKLLLLEKPRKFLILRYVLIIELSRKPHIKFLDAKLNFEKHLKVVTTKVNKAIGPLQKLHKNLSKTGINDYIKRFCETTPRLWWRNLWWRLQQSISSEIWVIQHNVCLALSEAITGSSSENLKSVQHRRWYRKLCLLY